MKRKTTALILLASLAGVRAAEALNPVTWLGSIAVTPQGQTALQALQAGQGLYISASGIRPIATQPPVEGPRPDSVNVPPKLLDGRSGPIDSDGVVVFIRDGVIETATLADVLGIAGKGQKAPATIPKYVDFSKLPRSGSKPGGLPRATDTEDGGVALMKSLQGLTLEEASAFYTVGPREGGRGGAGLTGEDRVEPLSERPGNPLQDYCANVVSPSAPCYSEPAVETPPLF